LFGSEGAANLLQLAIQAATPHQREVERDFPVESFCLLLPLILVTAILATNGTAGVGRLGFPFPIRARPEATANTLSTLDQRGAVSSIVV